MIEEYNVRIVKISKNSKKWHFCHSSTQCDLSIISRGLKEAYRYSAIKIEMSNYVNKKNRYAIYVVDDYQICEHCKKRAINLYKTNKSRFIEAFSLFSEVQ